MAFVVEVPVNGGGRLLVEASDLEDSDELYLASRPGAVIARARESLEESLDQLQPAVGAILQHLTAFAPDELTVEFGLKVSAETGVVVAKGTGEVHFTVTLSWQRDGGSRFGEPSPAGPSPAASTSAASTSAVFGQTQPTE